MTKMLILRILLIFVAASHLLLGLAGTLIPPGQFADSIIQVTYGGSFEIGPVTHHVIRILGAFMMAVGVMAAFAAFDPRRYVAVIYVIMFLFIVRTLQRLIFAEDIEEHFGIALWRLIGQSIFYLALGVALVLLRPRQGVGS